MPKTKGPFVLGNRFPNAGIAVLLPDIENVLVKTDLFPVLLEPISKPARHIVPFPGS